MGTHLPMNTTNQHKTMATPGWLQDYSERSGEPQDEYECSERSGEPQDEYEYSEGSQETGSSNFDEISKADEMKTKKPAPPPPSNGSIFRSVAMGMFSSLLLILFLLAAAARSQGVDSVPWVLFYALNAAVPAIFLIYWSCCFPVMVLHVIAMFTAVWSIVFLLMAATQVQEESDPKGESIDSPFQIHDDVNELTGEITSYAMQQNSMIAMASMGFLSSMYHSVMAERFIIKEEDKDETDKDIEIEIESDDDDDDENTYFDDEESKDVESSYDVSSVSSAEVSRDPRARGNRVRFT